MGRTYPHTQIYLAVRASRTCHLSKSFYEPSSGVFAELSLIFFPWWHFGFVCVELYDSTVGGEKGGASRFRPYTGIIRPPPSEKAFRRHNNISDPWRVAQAANQICFCAPCGCSALFIGRVTRMAVGRPSRTPMGLFDEQRPLRGDGTCTADYVCPAGPFGEGKKYDSDAGSSGNIGGGRLVHRACCKRVSTFYPRRRFYYSLLPPIGKRLGSHQLGLPRGG